MSDFFNVSIGFIGAIIGSIIGGVFSYKGSKSATKDNIEAQKEVIRETKNEEALRKEESITDNIKMIYLDFISAVWEAWLINKAMRENASLIPMFPMNTLYAQSISLVSDKFNTDELILINKIYGMIEKIRYDIFNLEYNAPTEKRLKSSVGTILTELYKDNFEIMHRYNPDLFTRDFALENLSVSYKLLFGKLREYSRLN